MSVAPGVLTRQQWQARRAAHEARVEPWIAPRLTRRLAGERQPTDDFLFEYYPFSPNKLRTWHPGHGIVLEDADEFLANPAYARVDGGVTTMASSIAPRLPRLDLAISILEQTSNREPVTGCFALHEWAMVYGLQQSEVRHSSLPLRLTPDEIRTAVDAIGLRCTHIDAYRFFTDEATPLNAHEPTRATQPAMEQPGCLHASMDLYKYAFWFSPFVASELIADCFELARSARALDMQASPYDVSYLELTTIPIETTEGRAEYLRRQRSFAEAAAPLRARLLSHLTRLRAHAG